MKAKIIELYKMKMVAETKWNEIWQCREYTLIWNRATKLIKIKTNEQ